MGYRSFFVFLLKYGIFLPKTIEFFLEKVYNKYAKQISYQAIIGIFLSFGIGISFLAIIIQILEFGKIANSNRFEYVASPYLLEICFATIGVCVFRCG